MHADPAGAGAYHALGAAVNRPYMLTLLAEAYTDAGQPATGLQVVGEALALVETMGGYFFHAELARLRGTLLQEAADRAQATGMPEAYLRQALDCSPRCGRAPAVRRTPRPRRGSWGWSAPLAAEVRGRGVRVGALSPGAVDTPFWDGIPSPPDRSRMLRPEAVAEAALLVAAQPPGAFVEEIVLAPTPGVL